MIDRIDVELRVDTIEEALNFYIKQLGLFHIVREFGMGGFLLMANSNESVCIMLQEVKGYYTQDTVSRFTLGISNCKKMFNRLNRYSSVSGFGVVPGDNGKIGIFDTPIAAMILVKDPAGNHFTLAQWY